MSRLEDAKGARQVIVNIQEDGEPRGAVGGNRSGLPIREGGSGQGHGGRSH